MNIKVNMNEKTVVITGASSGIGLATAKDLAERRAYVIGVGRSQERCREAEESIRKAYPDAKICFIIADLSSLTQVRELAQKIKQKIKEINKDRLDVLINNAGTVSNWYRATEDGFELQFAVNYLSQFLLTHELMPLIQAAPTGRIISLSSGSHLRTWINWKDIMLRKHYNCLMAYKQTKLFSVLFCTELNRRIGTNQKTHAYAVDPGLVNTEIGFKGTTGIVKWVWEKRSSKGIDPAKAAESVAYLAYEPSIQNSTSVYWKECMPQKPSNYSQREDIAKRLWEVSEKMCRIKSEQYGLGFNG